MRMIVADVRTIAGIGTPSASLMERNFWFLFFFFSTETSCRILMFIAVANEKSIWDAAQRNGMHDRNELTTLCRLWGFALWPQHRTRQH